MNKKDEPPRHKDTKKHQGFYFIGVLAPKQKSFLGDSW
jgi:hypothetical protein